MGRIEILWQDDTALLVDKPSGLLVHNSAWAGPPEASLRQLLVRQLGARLHPVNRLDRGASGLVLLARSGEAARAWQTAWQSDETEKGYLALVRGHFADQAPVLVDHPIRDRRAGGASAEKAREARSLVTPLSNSPVARCALVEVRILTGRRHQVRRHLKHLSHPVVGDTTHGRGEVNRFFRESWALHRLALHATSLAITHPVTGERLAVTAPLPAELDAVFSALFPDPSGPGSFEPRDGRGARTGPGS